MKKIGKFLLEVSVVVIGVAITLSVSYWVGIKNEKRDMDLYLKAIKMELEENVITLDETVEYYRKEVNYAKYLRSHEKKSLNKDSIKNYADVYHTVRGWLFKTNAFEMFKSSGVMRLIDDKELALSIWDVYNGFVALKTQFEWLAQIKWDDLRKELSMAVDNGMEVKNVPMYNYYIIGFPYGALSLCEEMLTALKELISKLEEVLDSE